MSNSFFNSIDYFCILLTFASCLIGFFRGFVKDFFSTCSWVGSGFATAFVSPYIAHRLQENGTISNPTFAKIAAIVLSFTLVLITLLLIINILSKIVKATFFSGLDRALGALYGFIRGFIILIMLCVGAIMFNMFSRDWRIISDSKIIPYLMISVDYMMPRMISVPELKNQLSFNRSELEFTDEELREMERLMSEYKRKNTKSEVAPTISAEPKASTLKKLGDYFDNLISRIGKEDISSSTSTQKSRKRTVRIKNKDDNVEFGCMDLIKARAKRKAQKKAERLKKDLLKRLDR
jgi:membrane protein required for colicin V production